MRAAGVAVATCDLAYQGVTTTVYAVAPEAGVGEKLGDLQRWLDGGARSKEASHFSQRLSHKPETFGDEYFTGVDAWWSLADDIAWALDEVVARLLADGFNNPPNR